MTRCFIAMPITTPDIYAKQFNDTDHFGHVLDQLFKPALKQAGYESISPISAGSELIQAAIIKNLVECDLVLCDISILNPNVFFEVGIRTALNKPVVWVKDTLTPRIPFDASSINIHTYDAGLSVWRITSEIENLTKHISTTKAKSEDYNPLWRFFGVQVQAEEPAKSDDPTGAKLDLLLAEVAELKAREVSTYRMETDNASGYVQSTFPQDSWGTIYPNNPRGYFTYNSQVNVDPDLSSIDSAPLKSRKFSEQAKSIARQESAEIVIEGYNSRTNKVILTHGNWPLSGKTLREIDKAGQQLAVEYELRPKP